MRSTAQIGAGDSISDVMKPFLAIVMTQKLTYMIDNKGVVCQGKAPGLFTTCHSRCRSDRDCQGLDPKP